MTNMTVTIFKNRNVTINDELAKTFKTCYPKMDSNMIEFLLETKNITETTTISDKDLNKAVEDVLKDEVQTVIKTKTPVSKKKASAQYAKVLNK